ncbi:hypothetical protein Ga0074812_11199 [Parafrankia irregularis]|uniref:Uncharacterized protein n=1 Tax=Parafrankia irregularis TaxID=795642 RepID=A0A0S4QQ69_9ACTN|nr:hypothetical protein Ga0074812_11199 [Parafrankia irregularis]
MGAVIIELLLLIVATAGPRRPEAGRAGRDQPQAERSRLISALVELSCRSGTE